MRNLYFLLFCLVVSTFVGCNSKVNNIEKLQTGRQYRAPYNNGFILITFSAVNKSATGQLIMACKPVTQTLKIEFKPDEKSNEFGLTGTGTTEKINWQGTCEINDSSFTLEVKKPFSAKLDFSLWDYPRFSGYSKRYHDNITSKIKRTEVRYGKAEGYYVSKPVRNISAATYPLILKDVINDLTENIDAKMLDLRMDIYSPENDNQENRPLLLLIHGGAFIVGDKRDDLQVKLGEYFARRGYVVASINYRLGYFFIPGVYKNLERCMYKAIQDTRAALRYLSAHKNKYRIDPTCVFLAGNSAGGFTALHTAFMKQDEVWESTGSDFFGIFSDLGCLDCSSNRETGAFKIRGVVNLWGALADTSLIDSDEKIPMLLIHGDADQIVPEGFGYPFRNIDPSTSAFFSNKVAGSGFIAQAAQDKNIPVHFISLKKQGHEPQCDNEGKYNKNLGLIQDSMNTFLYAVLCGKGLTLKGPARIQTNENKPLYYQAEASEDMKLYWEIKGGIISDISANGDKATVTWFEDSTGKKISVKAVSPQGIVQLREITVKMIR